MRQQAAHTLQLMPNEHRSTFEQEAVPTKNALNTPHPALKGYQSRFLPAKTPAWRVVEQERNFAGQRPAVERLIREKHKRDKDAAERFTAGGASAARRDKRQDELVRGVEKGLWKDQHSAEWEARLAEQAKDKQLFLKNRERKLLVTKLMQEMADKEAKAAVG